MWNLPGPGFKPESPALAGRFFITEPPGKPSSSFLSRPQVSINNSSSTSGGGAFLSLGGQAKTVRVQWQRAKGWQHILKLGESSQVSGPPLFLTFLFCMGTERQVLGIVTLLSSLGRMWLLSPSLFYCLGACLMLLLCGFVAKQACLVGD